MEKLYKSTKDRKLEGVLGGLSENMNLDSSLVRVAFVLLTMFCVGVPGIVLYIILAMFLPKDIDLEKEDEKEDESKSDVILEKEEVKEEKSEFYLW